MAKFGQFTFGDEVMFSSVTGEAATPVPSDFEGERVPWLFTDYTLTQVYECAVNPLSAEMSSIEKTLMTKPTAAGGLVTYEGRSKPQTISFSGTILSEDQFRVFQEWFREKKQIRITDDLGQQNWILLTGFTPTRNYSITFPWRHEYQATGIVLDWGSK